MNIGKKKSDRVLDIYLVCVCGKNSYFNANLFVEFLLNCRNINLEHFYKVFIFVFAKNVPNNLRKYISVCFDEILLVI